MDQYVTGKTIKELREKKNLTQLELANIINVSDKTISKWETGKGLPDISLLESLAKALSVSVVELFEGKIIENKNTCANMLQCKFYVCPICGNIISSVGDTVVSCHGVILPPLEAEYANIKYEYVEDDIYINIDNEMTKENYISFIAGVSSDKVQIVKLYPESSAEARINRRGVKYLYYYNNRDGLFRMLLTNKCDNKNRYIPKADIEMMREDKYENKFIK